MTKTAPSELLKIISKQNINPLIPPPTTDILHLSSEPFDQEQLRVKFDVKHSFLDARYSTGNKM